jgi:hypothetical protein
MYVSRVNWERNYKKTQIEHTGRVSVSAWRVRWRNSLQRTFSLTSLVGEKSLALTGIPFWMFFFRRKSFPHGSVKYFCEGSLVQSSVTFLFHILSPLLLLLSFLPPLFTPSSSSLRFSLSRQERSWKNNRETMRFTSADRDDNEWMT